VQDGQRSASLIAQFQAGYDQHAADIARRLEAVASSDELTRMALSLGRFSADSGGFLNDAAPIAESHGLDFLEFVDADGHILSSAQAPAKFGYTEASIKNLSALDGKNPFLKIEELPQGDTLGLFAVRSTKGAERPIYVVGGQRLDRAFMPRFIRRLHRVFLHNSSPVPAQTGSLSTNSLRLLRRRNNRAVNLLG
jgi:two-component system nitrogen regulation sensor histidine kinase NtrY